MESKAIKIAYANAIVEKMWLKGIINDVEKEKICGIILSKILSKNLLPKIYFPLTPPS